MNGRLVAAAGLAAFAAASAVSAQDPGADGRNWSAVAACAAIDQADRRHDCVDDVLRRAGLLSDHRIAQAARQEFGREERAAPAAPAPRPQPAARPVAAAPLPPVAEINELATTVAAVRTVGPRMLLITTAEGSRWEQTQAETFNVPPRVGDAFSVERGAINGYRCRFANLSRYRCKRVD
jgi:hypothetical protein